MTDPIAEFVQKRVPEQHRTLFAHIRELILERAPELEERMRGGTEKYYGIPVYRGRRDAIAISPSKACLTMSFVGGAQFDDPHGMLGGAGKSSRTIKLRSLDDFDPDRLETYIRQAVEHDAA